MRISGTRDSFGIKNAFRDDQTGKTIDTWKGWEKAGFRNPLEVTKDNGVKARAKQKIDKINHDNKKHITIGG